MRIAANQIKRFFSTNNKSNILGLTEQQKYYLDQQTLNLYLDFHFSNDKHFNVENYPLKCAQIINDLINKHQLKKTNFLDLGCAVGRTSFELSKIFQQVTAIDFSQNFIDSANEILEKGELNYNLMDEGELVSKKNINLNEIVDQKMAQNKIKFLQGDACNLDKNLPSFDIIFCGNLIDRLYNPVKFLVDIQNSLSHNGVLVLSSPYTWMEQYTEKKNWIGGYYDQNQEKVETIQGLSKQLGQNLKEIEQPMDVEFVIRETRRKYQHSVANFTFWQKI